MPPTGWNMVACWVKFSSNSISAHMSASSSTVSGIGSRRMPASPAGPGSTL
jgi:hypothetical protein